MKNVLVLGAGLVARPLVRYLLAQDGVQVTVASLLPNEACAVIEGHAFRQKKPGFDPGARGVIP